MNPTEPFLVLQAISFAARAHQGQFRKDRVTPYAAHPLRVLTILTTVFGVRDAETLAAGALHDTIEDTTVDRDELSERFGERVADFVAILSKDKRVSEQERERLYFQGLAQAPVEVKLCKLADTFDNLVDSHGLTPEVRKKKIDKARELLDLFAPGFPEPWQHALEQVRHQLAAAQKLR